ncbi:MAG TPA: GIY-YIG nuclease family protein [Micromonosporaceae bacterium]
MKPRIVAELGTGPGVYRFRDARGRVLYIGRAVNLRRRVGSYWGDLRDRRHLRRMVPQIDRIEAVTCDSEHEAAWLERNLLERSLPRWNRTRGGQETPVYITLGASGLAIAYERDDGSFGPYLGSARVRTALSGLHRVLPLDYTNGRLTGTGRDLARIRGVVPGDRAGLIRTLSEVLAREPTARSAVHEELTRRRDVAAAALAFEHAARIQDEIAAVEWVCAPQRVTSDDTASVTVVGWHEGVSVRFGFSGGRMSTWTQRAGAEPADISSTPSHWVAFAQRNAQLAARLAAA